MIEDLKDQKELQMIVFRLASEEYALPITCIQEIIMLQNPTKMPKCPAFINGIINLRGRIIPIIDGKKKFQLEGNDNSTHESRIIVLEVNDQTIGLIVDAVSEVIHLKTDDIEPTPVDMGDDSDFLWGVGKFESRLLILLNPNKFLSSAESKDIVNLSKVTEAIKQTKEIIESATN